MMSGSIGPLILARGVAELVSVPENYLDLVDGSRKTFAFLATVSEAGNPQVSPVWFEYKAGQILINTARGRIKEKNMHKQKQVCILIPDPENNYRYVQIFGQVVSITEEGAFEHINKLSQFYTGKPWQLSPNDQKRLLFTIDITKILAH
jgi:PPOX class probable F420-dependent enzyme